MKTTPLPTLVRAFLARSPMSQAGLAQTSGVSLATINKIVQADADSRFDPEKTDRPIRKAIERIVAEDKIGGFGITLDVQRLREQIDTLERDYDELLETVTAIRDLVTRSG